MSSIKRKKIKAKRDESHKEKLPKEKISKASIKEKLKFKPLKNPFNAKTLGKALIFIPVLALFVIIAASSDFSTPAREKPADVNGDGAVSKTDVGYILNFSSRQNSGTSKKFIKRSDLDGDGIISANDAFLAQKDISVSVIVEEAEAEPTTAATAVSDFEIYKEEPKENQVEDPPKKELYAVVSPENDVYNVISNDKMYIYPDMSEVLAVQNAFTIVSFGHGHGVGMSQWGAVGLADAGYSYTDILQHYFPGVAVMQEQYPPTVVCGGQNVDTVQMIARIVEAEIAGCVRKGDAKGKEALKAQAVAAYSCVKYSGYKVRGCAYKSSYDRCRDDVKEAAREVAGQYISYNDKVVYAYYSACSAGVTANFEDVWGPSSGDMSYIRSASSYADCYVSDYIGTKVYSVNEMRNYILSYDPSINLSDNPAEWIEILKHDDAVNENIGYVSSMRIGDKVYNQAAGLLFRDKVMRYKVKSPCFVIVYNGQYL